MPIAEQEEELYIEHDIPATQVVAFPPERPKWFWPLVVLGLAFVSPFVFALGSRATALFTEVHFPTAYQTVLLANGQVYFGKLSGFGGPHPLLTDVYYVEGVVNPQTKEASNTLLKRGSEWHAPDRMWLNPNQIIMVEPVKADSRVGQLISQLKNR